jgi:GNAT superfamily N-acetyltransferase
MVEWSQHFHLITHLQQGNAEILAHIKPAAGGSPRVATVTDAATVAVLLDAFNREFHTPTPGPAVLAARLRLQLARTDVIALLAGNPAVAVALLTLRPNIWYDGPVALLDELYVAPEVRGLGIGSALLDSAESITRERGGRLLEINVDGADHDARRFYERHGYTNTEPGQDEPALYYHRELPDAP